MSDWLAQVKAWPAAVVAARFGLPVMPRGRDVSFPCPACGQERRHTKTRRHLLAAKASPEHPTRWGCFANGCAAKGDAVTLAAWLVLKSARPTRAEEWREVRRECAALGLCEGEPGDTEAPAVRRYVPPPPIPREEPKRAPAAEVAALWAAALRLDAVPSWKGGVEWCGDARAFLAERGFDVARLAALDAARILPPGDRCAWPEWWPASWARSWRLAVPLYAPGGELVGCQARAVDGAERKTTNPKGVSITGAFFADAGGLEVLRGAYRGAGVAVVEGLTDFLAAAQLAAGLEAGRRPAVLGVVAGSPSALAGVRPPAPCRLVVITDNDDTGERYFREVTAALPAARWARVRLRPLEGKRADLNDYLKHHPALAVAALTHGQEGGAHGG